jgi:thiosulfate/3-mercaptopyruvate sulfurtransferase
VSVIELEELAARLEDDGLTVVDVRALHEYDGSAGAHCDPRQGHIPGALHVDLTKFLECATVEDVHALVGLAPGAEIAAYCHTGARSAVAVQILNAAGYVARNYPGSWHEWSAHADLPAETAVA